MAARAGGARGAHPHRSAQDMWDGCVLTDPAQCGKKPALNRVSQIQNTLIASLAKLEKSNTLTSEELQWLRCSVTLSCAWWPSSLF